jgi:hypothetical protein
VLPEKLGTPPFEGESAPLTKRDQPNRRNCSAANQSSRSRPFSPPRASQVLCRRRDERELREITVAMRKRTFDVAAATFACAVLTVSTKQACAQDANGGATGQPAQIPQPPVYPPGYAPAGPGYPTPLSEQPQPSYVLQGGTISGPPVVKNWPEGEPIPLGYHSTTRTRIGPVVGGAVLFGVTYLARTLFLPR